MFGRHWITAKLAGKNRIRADGNSVVPDFQMQMVSKSTPGCAHSTDDGVGINFLTLLNKDFRKVGVKGSYLVSMVDDNGIAVGILGSGNFLNAALFNGSDRVSGKSVKVDSGVEEPVALGNANRFDRILSRFFGGQGNGGFSDNGLLGLGVGKNVVGHKRGGNQHQGQVGTQDPSDVFVLEYVPEIAGDLIAAPRVFNHLKFRE